jgi:hypothetical protein
VVLYGSVPIMSRKSWDWLDRTKWEDQVAFKPINLLWEITLELLEPEESLAQLIDHRNSSVINRNKMIAGQSRSLPRRTIEDDDECDSQTYFGIRLKTTERLRCSRSRGSRFGTKVALAVRVTEAFAGTLNTCVSGWPMR